MVETKNKVFVAIDIQNLWYAAQEAFGKSYRVDFAKLRTLLTSNLPATSEIEAIAYVVMGPDHDNQAFINMLKRLNYVVKTRYMRFDKARGLAYKSDWDVGITVDALTRGLTNEIDKFILVSGDGDYFYLCEALQKIDIEVDVYTFSNVCSKILKKAADRTFILEKEITYNTRRS